jgi:hypothetical protein
MQRLDIMRRFNASVRSESDSWADAIVAAEAGDATRLLDCARGYKPFAQGDRELLARYVARKLLRRRLWPPELERVLSGARDDFDLPHVGGLDLLAARIEKRKPGRADMLVHRTAREVEIALRHLARPRARRAAPGRDREVLHGHRPRQRRDNRPRARARFAEPAKGSPT